MKKPLKKIFSYKYALYSIVFFSFTTFGILFLFIKFPIQSELKDNQNNNENIFTIYWPSSSLTTEMLNRKRLKRYSKTEVKRRIENQFNNMKYVSVPIYDLIFDKNSEILTHSKTDSPDKTSFLWPVLQGNLKIKNAFEKKLDRKSSILFIPNNTNTKIIEGFYLSSGEELRSNIPISKHKRYLVMSILPITPGNLRVGLGQGIWTKNISSTEVNKIQKFIIPINDSLATNYRLINISTNFYLYGLTIVNILENGREKILISSKSHLWSPNKSLIINDDFRDSSHEVSSGDFEEIEDDNIENIQNQKNTKNSKIEIENDEDKNESANNSLQTEYFKTIDVENDPLSQIGNKQVIRNNPGVLAKGYNVVFLTINGVDYNQLKTKKILQKVMPSLSNFSKISLNISDNLYLDTNEDKNYRDISISNYQNFNIEDKLLLKQKLNQNYLLKTPEVFQKYGYRSASFSDASSLLYSDQISGFRNFPTISNSWLTKHDVILQTKSDEINSKFDSHEGLNAIFTKNNLTKLNPIYHENLLSLGDYLKKVSLQDNTSNFWGYDDSLIIDKKNYTANLIESFQKWIADNRQYRLFLNVKIDSQYTKKTKTIQDLIKVYKEIKTFDLKELSEYSNYHLIDRGFNQIRDTLRANRVEHRSIIFLIIKNKNDPKKSTAMIYIPGLIPKKINNDLSINLNNLITYSQNLVGFPSNNTQINPKDNPVYTEIGYKQPSLENNEDKYNYIKYEFMIYPNENFCDSFSWNTENSKIVAVESNYHFFTVSNKNKISFYPCSFKKKLLKIKWYQKSLKTAPDDKSATPIKNLKGFFTFQKTKLKVPIFYFGKDFISLSDLFFNKKSLSETEINDTFFSNEEDQQQILNSASESLSALNENSLFPEQTRAFLLLSKIH